MKALALLALLMLVACTPVQPEKYYVCEDGTQVKDLSTCPKDTPDVDTTSPVIKEPEPVDTRPMPKDVKEIIDKTAKVKVVKFNYFDTQNPYLENDYLAGRNKTKVLLETKARFSQFDQYDTVYLDTLTKRAVAYCEDIDDELCPLKNAPTAVNYTKFAVMTPFDWLSMMEYGELTGRTRVIEGRSGKEVKFTSKGKEGFILLDSFFGVPMHVTYDGINYEYRNLVINENKESELTHQQID